VRSNCRVTASIQKINDDSDGAGGDDAAQERKIGEPEVPVLMGGEILAEKINFPDLCFIDF